MLNSTRWIRVACGAILALAMVLPGPAVAGEEGAEAREKERAPLSAEQRREILNGLEHGIHALRKLGRAELAEHLLEIAHEVAREGRKSGKGRKRDPERDHVEQHIEIIKVGVPILVEAGRSDAAEQLEQAAHARELMIEGRGDKEAMRIRETAPDNGQLAELLNFAAHHAEKQGKAKQAGWLSELGQHYVELWQRDRAKKGKAKAKRGAVPDGEQGLLRAAMDALLEADKHDRAHRVEQALHWRRMRAEGRTDAEAREARRDAPTPKQLASQLRFAADLWLGWGHDPMGRALDGLAARLEGTRAKR